MEFAKAFLAVVRARLQEERPRDPYALITTLARARREGGVAKMENREEMTERIEILLKIKRKNLMQNKTAPIEETVQVMYWKTNH